MAGKFMQPKWRLAGAQLNCRTMDGLCHEKNMKIMKMHKHNSTCVLLKFRMFNAIVLY